MKQNVQTAKNVLARREFVSCAGWRAVSKCIKSGAGNSDTALGIKLDLQRDWGGGGTMFLGLVYDW